MLQQRITMENGDDQSGSGSYAHGMLAQRDLVQQKSIGASKRSLLTRFVHKCLDLLQHILLLVAFLMFFSYIQVATASEHTDQHPEQISEKVKTQLSEVIEGSLLLRSTQDEKYQTAPLVKTDLEMRVSGKTNNATITQIFRNPLAEQIEAVYYLPLPEGAVIDSVQIIAGDRIIKGVLQERQKVFATLIENIKPNETIQIIATYRQTIKYEQGQFHLRIPMANNLNPTSLHLELDAGFPLTDIDSLSHDIHISSHGGGRYSIRFKGDSVSTKRDFELVWKPEAGYEILNALPATISSQPTAELITQAVIQPVSLQDQQQSQVVQFNAQTATNSQLKLLIGLICIGIALFIRTILFRVYPQPQFSKQGLLG